ncbi:hypothetical protein IM774_04680 [Erysipelotrichaceae bacterium RD49]|nr:hypothetical protein [Erysipelotrichaceae bacterium RD49]
MFQFWESVKNTIEDILAEAVQAYVHGGDLNDALQQAQQQAEGAVNY